VRDAAQSSVCADDSVSRRKLELYIYTHQTESNFHTSRFSSLSSGPHSDKDPAADFAQCHHTF
jgi:hypothetical protein